MNWALADTLIPPHLIDKSRHNLGCIVDDPAYLFSKFEGRNLQLKKELRLPPTISFTIHGGPVGVPRLLSALAVRTVRLAQALGAAAERIKVSKIQSFSQLHQCSTDTKNANTDTKDLLVTSYLCIDKYKGCRSNKAMVIATSIRINP